MRIIPDRTKYPFKSLELEQEVTIDGSYRHVRVASYGFRKRYGMMFIVKPVGDNKVKIKRYK